MGALSAAVSGATEERNGISLNTAEYSTETTAAKMMGTSRYHRCTLI
jgi:hypothetical protein